MRGFLGVHPVAIDSSGRFNVPAKFKAVFDETYGANVVICCKEKYLLVYPLKEWAKTEEKLLSLNTCENETDRRKIREVFQNATYSDIKSGKISIPHSQREKVEIRLQEEAILIGMANSFEIWSKIQFAKESR